MVERLSEARRFDVWHEVPLVPQRTEMSCWAAAAAMIVGWRDCLDVAQEEIVRGTGQWASYRDGLHPADVDTLRRVWRLEVVPDGRIDLTSLWDLLARHGPLWVGEAAPGLHVVVLTGAYGDGTPEGSFLRVNDPWPEGRGERYTLAFSDFLRGFQAVEALAGVPACVLHAGGGSIGRGTRVSSAYRMEYRSDGPPRYGIRGHVSRQQPVATIIVDPGHGGASDLGCSSANRVVGARGTREKALTLDVGRRLARLLAADGHAVSLTRENDANVSAHGRARRASEERADVFLSIHFNGSDDASEQGTEVLVRPRGGRDLRMLDPASRRLAEAVRGELVSELGHPDLGLTPGPFSVLDEALHDERTARCISEVSYLTDPREEARLASEAYRERIAGALARGVNEALRRRPG